MKIVYIAHPIKGDKQANLKHLGEVVQHINLTMPDILPFVPYYCDACGLDEDDPEQRKRGINNGSYWLRRRIPSELWITGTHISEGMAAEIKICEERGIRVVDMRNELP